MEIFFQIASKALLKTKNELEILKEKHVVDAGAMGFVKIIEGMAYFLKNDFIMKQSTTTVPILCQEQKLNNTIIQGISDNLGYCCEFLLIPMLNNNFQHISLQQYLTDNFECESIVLLKTISL
jgi:dihydroxyacetone kinase-like predicted kinase